MNTNPEHIGNELNSLTDKELQRVLLQYQKKAGFSSVEEMLSHLKEIALCKHFDCLSQIDVEKNDWLGHFLNGDLAIKINNEDEYLAFYDYLSKHNAEIVNLALWKRDIREYDPLFPYFFMNAKGKIMDATRNTKYLNNYNIYKVVDFSELGICEEKENAEVDR